VHINGHTPGFTVFRYKDVLLLCYYIFYNGRRSKFNPYGPVHPTRQGGAKLYRLLQEWEISLVCGFDYVANFAEWQTKFEELLSHDLLTEKQKLRSEKGNADEIKNPGHDSGGWPG